MIIFNQLYDVLKGRLNAVSSVKKVDWYNDQYRNMDDEKATRYPAVYIEFIDPLVWRQSGRNFQLADCKIRLHCVVFDLTDSPIRTLNVAQDVFLAINGKSLYDTSNFQLTTELVRTESDFPKRYNQLKVEEINFSCEVFDVSDMPQVVATNPTFTILPSI